MASPRRDHPRHVELLVPLTDAIRFGAGDPTRYDGTHLKLSVYFNAGGISYYDYKDYPRGFYLSIGPVRIEVGERFTSEISALGSASGFFLEPATRFSSPRLGALAAKFFDFGTPDKLAAAFVAGDGEALKALVAS